MAFQPFYVGSPTVGSQDVTPVVIVEDGIVVRVSSINDGNFLEPVVIRFGELIIAPRPAAGGAPMIIRPAGWIT